MEWPFWPANICVNLLSFLVCINFNAVLRKPCQPNCPQTSEIRGTSATITWSNDCTSDFKVAAAEKYFISCLNRTQTSTTATIYNLHPNTRYPCYVYAVDNFERFSDGADCSFSTSKIGKNFFVSYINLQH